MNEHESPNEHQGVGSDDAPGPAEALGSMLGGLDLGSLLGMAQEMIAGHQSSAETEVVGSAGGGAVQIRVTGGGEFLGVDIAPELVDPEDVSLLEDTILAALHDAMEQIQRLQRGAMGGLAGLLGPGDLGGLSGLTGSGGRSGPES